MREYRALWRVLGRTIKGDRSAVALHAALVAARMRRRMPIPRDIIAQELHIA
jgi:hypothetical protein